MENLFSGCYICNNYYLSLTDKALYLVARARGQEHQLFWCLNVK